jgi:hypothetical protein
MRRDHLARQLQATTTRIEMPDTLFSIDNAIRAALSTPALQLEHEAAMDRFSSALSTFGRVDREKLSGHLLSMAWRCGPQSPVIAQRVVEWSKT